MTQMERTTTDLSTLPGYDDAALHALKDTETAAASIAFATATAGKRVSEISFGEKPRPTLWGIARISSCLQEAVMAARCRNIFIDPQTIMAINAKAKIPQTSETIVGTALFNFILFSTRCASRDLLSPEGIIELRRRVRVTSLALQKAFPKSDGTAHESSTPIVDAAELTRQLRLGMEKPWDYPDLVALRIIMSAALADCGATRRWRFLGGSSLTPQDLKALDEQRDDQAAWRGTFIRLVARASQRQKQHLINIRRLHDEYLEKLKAYKIDQPSRQATVDILFARPILSRADLVKELHRREIKCADRTAQAILAEFAEARIVRSFGAKTLWQAENLLLSGVSGQT